MRRQGGFFYSVKIIIILALMGAGFFCTEKVWAADQGVLINEIMYDLKGADDKHEWIEIYNSGSEAVDLTGWKFNDGDGAVNHALNPAPENGSRGSMIIPVNGFALLAGNAETLASDLPNYSGTIIDTVMSLNNTAAQLKLFNAEGAEMTAASYNKNSGANGNGKTLEWDGNVFKESLAEGGTPGEQNTASGAVNPPNPPLQGGQDNTASSTDLTLPSPSQGEGDNTASTTEENTNPPNPLYQGGVKVNFGEVVINELVSDPADNEVEWIEIFNKSGKQIDLAGWYLEDGSKTKTNLSGSLDRYMIEEKPAGNLNNNGDLIALYDATGKIIDQAAYGNWPDGNLDDNALAAPDPASVARIYDGYNTFNNANDFAVTLKPTKGAANLIEVEDEVSAEAKAKFDFSPDIYISEILPNPAGDDSKLEFIEIYNAGARPADLSGWSLSNEGGKKVYLEKIATSTVVGAGEYLALYRPRTKTVLHNDQGETRLFQPLADKAWQSVKYKNAEEGWSYNLTPLTPLLKGGEWEWSEMPTPGTANVIKQANHAPEVSFSFKTPALVNTPVIFDSSDSFDADGDELKYSWDFGDGFKNSLADPDHTFLKVGIYRVKLEVSDGKEIGEKEKSVKVAESLGEATNILDSRLRGNDKIAEVARNDSIILNEILPNPKGADTGQEWLELKNQSAQRINLLNWRVASSNGKYKFSQDAWLEAENFYLLNNAVSQLALKNDADAVNLFDGAGQLIDSLGYADAAQDASYARGANGNWFWTVKPTPGSENTISVADGGSYISKNLEVRSKNENTNYLEITLEKVRDLEVGSLVKVKGTVAVEPGVLGAQFFYIVGSPGLQVYNYQKDFPALKVGDYVEVAGELAQAQGELRLKTKVKADIKIDEHKEPPPALAMSADAVNEDNVGQLISVSGEITDKKSSTLYLDDGNDEVLVYIKKGTGISTKNLTPGMKVTVTGILSKTASGVRLMPRSQEDMVAVSQNSELMPQVLGEVADGNEWEVAARDKKKELFIYLLIIAGGVIVVLTGLFVKAKKKS